MTYYTARSLLTILARGCGRPVRSYVRERWRTMESINIDEIVGRQCMLLKPVRDQQGQTHFSEKPRILREVNNLNRRMFLVQFADGSTTFLFPDEVNIE
jgi:hypothetical protein